MRRSTKQKEHAALHTHIEKPHCAPLYKRFSKLNSLQYVGSLFVNARAHNTIQKYEFMVVKTKILLVLLCKALLNLHFLNLDCTLAKTKYVYKYVFTHKW